MVKRFEGFNERPLFASYLPCSIEVRLEIGIKPNLSFSRHQHLFSSKKPNLGPFSTHQILTVDHSIDGLRHFGKRIAAFLFSFKVLEDKISVKGLSEEEEAMEKSPEIHFPKLGKPASKKQTATVVVGALAVAWLAIEIVFKPLFKKLNSPKDKPDSDEAAAAAPPASDS